MDSAFRNWFIGFAIFWAVLALSYAAEDRLFGEIVTLVWAAIFAQCARIVHSSIPSSPKGGERA